MLSWMEWWLKEKKLMVQVKPPCDDEADVWNENVESSDWRILA